MLPDASLAIHYMLVRMQGLIAGINVYPQNMQANLDKTKDVIFSGAILLSLVNKGLTREAAYAIVQAAAFKARADKISLEQSCLQSADIKKYLSPSEIKSGCDLNRHYKNVEYIFKRVFKD
jgi:adenylosuccinate lyase